MKAKKTKLKWAVVGGEYARSDNRAKVVFRPHPQFVAVLDYHYTDDHGEWRVVELFLGLHDSWERRRSPPVKC